ncbi:conserved protein of unknown function, putative PRC-barrel domains [Modestobacter italicus]|uniref:DUF2382 domain-containing protein n=1 Tax=Modestobacter italicus (strain DSM 44449 / CECT 9708 / BC 501) TaxID=2732864 RepID=I4F597_MODI5|nr:PRC and DUF2382 domain-containing protein [Modestobacter marinus]CCH90810.1 conserved protein of unknown function, putative PRC-barrel domains [Modestobacter marinus]
MIGTDTLDRVIGADVYDADGSKIGTASEVFLDDQSGNPEWVTVKTGLFGTKETFVPIREADLTSDGLRVPVSKAQVKDAPKIDTDGHLSPQEEEELYRYYGVGGTGRHTDVQSTTTDTSRTTTNTGMGAGVTDRVGDTTANTTTGYTDTDVNRHGTKGHDTSGPTTDDAMTLSEERVNVGTQQVEAGRARLRKYVVTENVTQTVPVSHEEVRVQREPITDANVGNALDGPAISEEEHEVTLHAERPVVEKEAVPVERVRLDTETVTEQVQVNEQVRKERVDTDDVTTGRDTTRGTTTGDNRSLKDKAKDAISRDDDRR